MFFAVGTRVTSRPPHRSVRAQFGHTACMGLSLSRRDHAISVVLCHSILLFDLRRKHSFVPTAYLHRRRAQRQSRTALLQRRRRLVLDGRERGGRLLAIGWLARAMIRGEPAIGRDQSREPRLYSVEPYGVQTMKQSYASAGKAPRRRVHSLSGIAAIAECGLPPPRIVIGYPAHQAQSGAEPFFSFLVIECCSRRRPQLDTVRHLAGRDQAPQRDQQHARQRAVFLEHQEAPRQLDQPTSYPRIASLGQALLSAFQTALVGRSREPG